MIPNERPERSFVAKFPSVATTRGRTSVDLAEQVRLAGGDLRLERVAVLRRPALEDVREIHVVAGEADPGEQPLEQLARLLRRTAVPLILVEAGSLADDHQLGVGIARAEDDLRPRLGERAAHTAGGVGRVRGERLGTGKGIHRTASLGAIAGWAGPGLPPEGHGISRSRRSRRSSRRAAPPNDGFVEAPWTANAEICFSTSVALHDGQVTTWSSLRTSSSKWSSHSMHAYS